MNKIASFTIDHTLLEKGLYVSRIDGDIVTYDLRMQKPNAGEYLSHEQIHSFEHMLATVLRSGKLSEHVVYVGPMGCQTGFYVLIKNASQCDFVSELKCALQNIITSDTMYGDSAYECGNYQNLSLAKAKQVAARYLDVIKALTLPQPYIKP